MNAQTEMTAAHTGGRKDPAEACPEYSAQGRPIAIYQVHLPSWMRVPEEQNRPLTFREIAPKLAAHAVKMGFTHIQLHSIGSTPPGELKFLIEHLRLNGLGIILETDQLLQKLTANDLNDPIADGLCVQGETLLGDQECRWNWAWAEETLAYFSTDPLYRKFRHVQFTHEVHLGNHVLPLSDHLVTPPRPSLWAAMPGDLWRKFANLRLLYAYQYLLPGKKLIFMGNEFGQPNPWRPETSLDWHVLHEYGHGKLMDWVGNLNRFYREERALHADSGVAAFQWVDTSDAESSVVSFLRRDANKRENLLVVLNFTPAVHHNYRIGVPQGGFWAEILNSDAQEFGGSGQGNLGGIEAAPFGWNFQSHSLMLTLPPLAAVVLKRPG